MRGLLILHVPGTKPGGYSGYAQLQELPRRPASRRLLQICTTRALTRRSPRGIAADIKGGTQHHESHYARVIHALRLCGAFEGPLPLVALALAQSFVPAFPAWHRVQCVLPRSAFQLWRAGSVCAAFFLALASHNALAQCPPGRSALGTSGAWGSPHTHCRLSAYIRKCNERGVKFATLRRTRHASHMFRRRAASLLLRLPPGDVRPPLSSCQSNPRQAKLRERGRGTPPRPTTPPHLLPTEAWPALQQVSDSYRGARRAGCGWAKGVGRARRAQWGHSRGHSGQGHVLPRGRPSRPPAAAPPR